MKHTIPYITVLTILFYAAYNAYIKKNASSAKISVDATETCKKHVQLHTGSHIKEELAYIHTLDYRRSYIINVINHGSSQLHFKPQEIMEGGFASPQDAPSIACYVISLGGETCEDLAAENAAMFYSSNCAGCHGDDGKGLNGTYPDLTRRPLLGIEKRETYLKRILQKQ